MTTLAAHGEPPRVPLLVIRGTTCSLASRTSTGRTRVRDTGIGMPQESLGTIFGMFSQLTPALERPQLVIGLPVGFVGTRETKDDLRKCLQVPRITNSGTRGGSPWAASVVNGLMIDALNGLAAAGAGGK